MSLPYLHPYLGLSNGLNTLHAAGGGGGAVGGWKELGRTTLGSANDNITVSGLADKRYLMTLFYSSGGTGGNSEISWQLNSDTGSNYSVRYSSNGGGDGYFTSKSYMHGDPYDIDDTNPRFSVSYLSNYASKEKLHISHSMRSNTAGAANAPARGESVSKWSNTSNAVSSITANNRNTGTWSTNDEVVVLGWDPADTHTNNFWQELASVDWSSGNTIDTGSFTSKKYLWVQMSYQSSASNWSFINFNSDNSATKYAGRTSINGGADGTIAPYSASEQYYQVLGEGGGSIYANNFVNMFMINNASNEKLGIVHSYQIKSTELGAGSPGSRFESVIKYAETTNPITQIELIHDTNDFEGGTIKVWGSD